MIPIKINGIKNEIPTFNELTVEQYIKYRKAIKRKKDFSIIDYLSIVLKTNYKAVYFSKIKKIQFLSETLGQVKDYSKIKPKKEFIINKEIYKLESYSIQTVGQRFMIQENGKKFKDTEEFLCFVLAVCIIKEVNLNKIIELKDLILKEYYIDILPTAFFLLRNLMTGLNKGKNIFQQLKRLMSMKH